MYNVYMNGDGFSMTFAGPAQIIGASFYIFK